MVKDVPTFLNLCYEWRCIVVGDVAECASDHLDLFGLEGIARPSWDGDLASVKGMAAASPLPVLKSPKHTIQVSGIQ